MIVGFDTWAVCVDHERHMKRTLVVLAAGTGSRYGGLKQIDPVGPGGEAIIDYSVYDAIRAGFDKLVFVIRRDIEQAFKETVGRRFESRLAVEYVFQELDLPSGTVVPPARKKPWGTGHAILMAAAAVAEPFAVINADDFYGADSFRVLGAHLGGGGADYAMVGFTLRNTVSDFGSVSRGVCDLTPDGCLKSVVEVIGIEKEGRGVKPYAKTPSDIRLSGDEIVSLNMWGFNPSLFDHLRRDWSAFITANGQSDKAEFFIPTVINNLVSSGRARLKVLPTASSWFGVTYREDRPRVIESIRKLIAAGEYPERLRA
jgi:dTDP-glucose pyrophosphorylase